MHRVACRFASSSNTGGVTCEEALDASDDEFWLTSKPNGYLHTGQFDLWNLTTKMSAFAVRAETEVSRSTLRAQCSSFNQRE